MRSGRSLTFNSKDARKVEVVKGDVFKYLGSTIQSNGQYIIQVKKVLAELRESRVRGDLWKDIFTRC